MSSTYEKQRGYLLFNSSGSNYKDESFSFYRWIYSIHYLSSSAPSIFLSLSSEIRGKI